LKNIINLSTKWRWGLGMLGAKRYNFGNIVGHTEGASNASSLAAWTNEKFDAGLDWARVKELRNMWEGPVILKGIMDVEDAKKAVEVGVDAIVVSNHGGRQLDGALSSIRALEPIVNAVGDKLDVYLDSGIRSGQDILKAMAMGAKGTMIGRSYIYGLGAMGEAGVTKALEVMQKELDISMALCGRSGINAVDKSILMVPDDFSGRWS